jgi:hypothetical protein
MLWFFKYFRRKILQKNWRFWLNTKLNFWKKVDHNIGIQEKRQFFRRKLSKIAENCDHNIDPWGRFYESVSAEIYGQNFKSVNYDFVNSASNVIFSASESNKFIRHCQIILLEIRNNKMRIKN